jgi:hypothetical protein
METTTNREGNMNTSETEAAQSWDSEKRNSPFSTVADIEDEYCDTCGDEHTCEDCK